MSLVEEKPGQWDYYIRIRPSILSQLLLLCMISPNKSTWIRRTPGPAQSVVSSLVVSYGSRVRRSMLTSTPCRLDGGGGLL
jgi:hypothetical protein